MRQANVSCFLDDDFQCPMDKLWELLEPLNHGYDVSLAQYKFEDRKESFFRVAGSRFNDFMMCVLLDKPKHLRLTNFMAMQSFIAAELLQYKNPYPYIDGLLLRATRKIAEVPMQDRERLSGTSTYNLEKADFPFLQWIYRFFYYSTPAFHLCWSWQFHSWLLLGIISDHSQADVS